MKAFQLLLPPLKNALKLPQFGMCIVIDICDTGGREGVFSKMFSPGPVQTKGLVNLMISYPINFVLKQILCL